MLPETMSSAALKQRRTRNLALAGILIGLALLMFAITIVRLSLLR
jgi:hypothetical protein